MMDPLMELPYVLTPREAAETARVSRDLIYDLCRQNVIPYRKLGREIRIPRDAFLKWLNGGQALVVHDSSLSPPRYLR